jgi:hypothetical protein
MESNALALASLETSVFGNLKSSAPGACNLRERSWSYLWVWRHVYSGAQRWIYLGIWSGCTWSGRAHLRCSECHRVSLFAWNWIIFYILHVFHSRARRINLARPNSSGLYVLPGHCPNGLGQAQSRPDSPESLSRPTHYYYDLHMNIRPPPPIFRANQTHTPNF